MGLRNRSDSEVHSFQEIYENSFDADVEQSTIYKGVYFSCIKEKIFGIVLTPACDIYWQKANYIKIAGLLPAEQIFEQWLLKNGRTPLEIAGVDPLPSEKRVRNIHGAFVKDYIANREIRYHFLPSHKNIFPHSFVDFQLVESFEPDYIKKLEKIAVLKSPWRESIPARYAAYCGRLGTKTYSENLVEKIMTKFLISHAMCDSTKSF